MRIFASLVIATLAVSSGLPAKTAKPAKPKKTDDSKLFLAKLDKSQQVEHALDRLTFGPRPGDAEEVRKVGLKKWIDRQLHPEKIKDDPGLEAYLKPLESLRMSQAELVRHYPAPALILAVANGRAPLPEDPIERAAVQKLAEKYKARQKAQGDKGGTANAMDDLEPAKPIDEVLTPGELRTWRRGTPEERKTLLVSLPDDKLDDLLIALPRPQRLQLLNIVPVDVRRKIMMLNTPQQVVNYDLSEAKLYRAIYSKRQLEEELVDFWYNHFNVFLDKGADRYFVPTYERESIRPYVLGKFREMLEATAKSPAMLFYLDNWQSVAPRAQAVRRPGQPQRGLNENYARELMELHTLGVDGGYTQKDIVEVARCFTGWTIRQPRLGGGFDYNDRIHDKGEKVVLGVKIPAGGGVEDGQKVLDILANHDSTARFISRKLAQRFVADNPPESLVDRVAATYRRSDGNIREMLKTLFESKEFWSKGAYRAKVKTPFEMIVSAVRALDARVESAYPLANRLTQLGQPLYRKVEPTGYSTMSGEWVNSAALLARMNFALALAQNRIPGVKVDATKFTTDPAQVAKTILFKDASPETRAAIEKALKEQEEKKSGPASPGVIAGLVIGSPEFQRR